MAPKQRKGDCLVEINGEMRAVCAYPDCGTILTEHNPGITCFLHSTHRHRRYLNVVTKKKRKKLKEEQTDDAAAKT